MAREFNKGLLAQIFGLSCIENYLLYAMKEQDYRYYPLYYHSFLSFGDIIHEFTENKAEFAFFYKIQRLHTTAENHGLICMEHHENVEDIPSGADQVNGSTYMAITVTPEYISGKYGAATWREDHYLLIRQNDEGDFYYLNDTPADSGKIDNRTLKNIFSGKVITFSLASTVNKELEKGFLNKFKEIIQCEAAKEKIVNTDRLIHEIQTVRDLIGVLKISRNRMDRYLSQYVDTRFLKPYLRMLDAAYGTIEYMRLRKRPDSEKIKNMMNELQDMDEQVIVKVEQVLKNLQQFEC